MLDNNAEILKRLANYIYFMIVFILPLYFCWVLLFFWNSRYKYQRRSQDILAAVRSLQAWLLRGKCLAARSPQAAR